MSRTTFPWNRTRRRDGFTLIESLASILIAAVAVLVTMQVVGALSGQLREQKLEAMGQGNVRVAVDEVTRALRSAGSGTDYSAGQTRFVFANPYTVVFNANLTPDEDDEDAAPTAVDPTIADAAIPLDGGQSYTPSIRFTTGAETMVATLDSNRDGQLTSADATDQDEENDTADPDDYVLALYTYGNDGAANVVASRGLGLVRGPATSGSSSGEPLFQYWIDDDNDPSTAPLLHGDTDSNGALSSGEIAALSEVSAEDLGSIEKIEIAATASAKEVTTAQSGGVTVREVTGTPVVLRSSVTFRNRNSTTARVVGTVYNDIDQDGVLDSGELGIGNVSVRSSSGQSTVTDASGQYRLLMNPGRYTITEIDAPGYTSTTENAVAVVAGAGDYKVVNFGDHSASGFIGGFVYEDLDRDGSRDTGERGIEGVRISLDTGMSVYTGQTGLYTIPVTLGTYVVTEVDSTGYASSTPNVVDANVATQGDSVRIDFGDYLVGATGTIHGIVYLDADNDQVRDAGEAGVPNARIELDDGQVTTTSTSGEFEFSATAGEHDVTETDPAGYTSSTVNTVRVTVVVGETVEVAFGDITQQDVQFEEIALANTQNALSVGTIDLNEDNKADSDLILGTHYVGGANDILVWFNGRTSASTPNSAIFNTAPSYQRVVASDVNALATVDVNSDGYGDVVTGLGSSTSNTNVWITMSTGSNKGKLPTNASANYTTTLASGVRDVAFGTCDDDSYRDFVIGWYSSSTTGGFEILHGASSVTSYTRATRDVYTVLPSTSVAVGAVRAVSLADFDGEGHADLVVAAQTGANTSNIYLLLYAPDAISDYQVASTITMTGIVNDVIARNMFEDDGDDIDIVACVTTSTHSGEIRIWHNDGANVFGDPEMSPGTPNDTANTGGAPLTVAVALVDNDVFPDLIVGTQSGTYTGQVIVFRAYGYLPVSGTVISSASVGEVITSTSADFNKDGAPDVAVGTRTSGSTGKVVVYFNVRTAL